MSTVEPMTAEEIASVAAWLSDVEREQPPASARLAIEIFAMATRLLATIRARDEEIAGLHIIVNAAAVVASYQFGIHGEDLALRIENLRKTFKK